MSAIPEYMERAILFGDNATKRFEIQVENFLRYFKENRGLWISTYDLSIRFKLGHRQIRRVMKVLESNVEGLKCELRYHPKVKRSNYWRLN